MKTASIAEVKARLGSLLKEGASQPVVVTRNGKAVGLLVGVEDDDELERLLLANSESLQAVLNAADRRIEQGKGIKHDQFWERVETATRDRGTNGKRKPRRAKS
jgi:prevent-host-death family protein